MIFAKTDVTLGRHHRVLRIPVGIRAEAIGVWTLALLWTRENERDGFCALEALDKVARRKIIQELERVGLVTSEADEDGVVGIRILRYEEHNEVKAEIDARKEADRSRKSKPGSRHERAIPAAVPSGIRTEADGIPSDGTRSVPVDDLAGIRGSDSLSLDLLVTAPDLDKDPSGSTGAWPVCLAQEAESGTLPIAKAVARPRPTLAPTQRTIDPKLPLNEEARATAEIVGIPVGDVAASWRKFVAKQTALGALSCNFYATWTAWATDESRYLKRERDRERQRGIGRVTGAPPSPVPMSPPKSSSGPPEPVATPEQAEAAMSSAGSFMGTFGKGVSGGGR